MDLAEAEIRFVLGARCLWSAKRDLVSVGWSLSDILAGSHVQRSDLPATADGYRFQSIPADRLPSVVSNPGLIASTPQFYPRHYIDMSSGYDGYLAQFSSKTRATLARKARKLAEASGGTLDMRTFRPSLQMRYPSRARHIKPDCQTRPCRTMNCSGAKLGNLPNPTICGPISCICPVVRSPISTFRWTAMFLSMRTSAMIKHMRISHRGRFCRCRLLRPCSRSGAFAISILRKGMAPTKRCSARIRPHVRQSSFFVLNSGTISFSDSISCSTQRSDRPALWRNEWGSNLCSENCCGHDSPYPLWSGPELWSQ